VQNKITLIVSDIHHKWALAEKIITKVPHDEVIFVGDFFDDFNDTPEMVQETCDWFNGSVKKPNRIHLFGNHDQHYAFPYRTFRCGGYEQWKHFIVQDSVSNDTWDKLKWYYILDDTWLISHAGLHRLNLPKNIYTLHKDRRGFLKAIQEYLDAEILSGFRAIENNVPHWIFNAGRSRGGMQRVGGITWCDFEQEFSPIKGLHQIMGHTPQICQSPKWCIMDKDGKVSYPSSQVFTPTEFDNKNISFNIDIDVYNNMHYAVWDGKSLIVKSHKD
jgi:hypothetical protein